MGYARRLGCGVGVGVGVGVGGGCGGADGTSTPRRRISPRRRSMPRTTSVRSPGARWIARSTVATGGRNWISARWRGSMLSSSRHETAA